MTKSWVAAIIGAVVYFFEKLLASCMRAKQGNGAGAKAPGLD
jgi:Na+/alanine symporter